MPPFTQSLSRGYPSFQNWYGQPGGGVENFPEYENFATFARDLGAFERRFREGFAQITLGVGEDAEFTWTVPADECHLYHVVEIEVPTAGIVEGQVERIVSGTTRIIQFAHAGVAASIPTSLIGKLEYLFAASRQHLWNGTFIGLPGDLFRIFTDFQPGTSPIRCITRYELIPIPVDDLAGVDIQALSI